MEYKKIKKFLNKRYDFYIDSLDSRPRYRKKKAKNKNFMLLTDYALNSIHVKIIERGIACSLYSLQTLINSEFSPIKNPLLMYLNEIDHSDDGVDYIDMIASKVATSNNNYFKKVFKKWFVGMVACGIGDGIANENMLIFIGKQALGKTRWIESLLPSELNDYFYGDEVNLSNKDHKALFASKILIHLDELTTFTRAQVEQFKSVLSAKKITYRRPYDRNIVDYDRRASLIGSSNFKDILIDISGNRRYLCFEVQSFDSIDENDLKKAYKQAQQLFEGGYKYYFDSDEILIINENNKKFMKTDETTEMISSYFQVCDVNNPSAVFMNASEVKQYIETHFKNANLPKVEIIGRHLTQLGFKNKKINGISKYAMILKNDEGKDIESTPLRVVQAHKLPNNQVTIN